MPYNIVNITYVAPLLTRMSVWGFIFLLNDGEYILPKHSSNSGFPFSFVYWCAHTPSFIALENNRILNFKFKFILKLKAFFALWPASLTKPGMSKSGNPWPKFTVWCLMARLVNSEKTDRVVVTLSATGIAFFGSLVNVYLNALITDTKNYFRFYKVRAFLQIFILNLLVVLK